MKFCRKKFRRFIGAYFAMGVAATVTHSAVVFTASNVIASNDDAPTVSADISTPAPQESSAPEAPESENSANSILPDSAITENAAAEHTADPSEFVDPDATIDTDTSSPVPATTPETTEITESNNTTESSTAETTPPSTSEEWAEGDISDAWPDRSDDEVAAEREPESEDITTENTDDTETPLAIEESIEEPLPDTWPQKVVSEPYIEPELPPYSEARSTLETVIPQLDWLYTLRPEALYEQIGGTKTQAATDLNELITILEGNAVNSLLNAEFCAIEDDLDLLSSLLSPGSDNSQPAIDAANLATLNEINNAVAQVRNTWLTHSRSTWQCDN